MTEIDLISKYLEKRGGKVKDITYFSDVVAMVDGVDYYVGAQDGYPGKDVFFFGHLGLDVLIYNTPLLTDSNVLVFNFNTTLKSRSTDSVLKIGVNLGMSLMGDGTYIGEKRLYGIGFNKFSVAKVDFGTALFSGYCSYNGYLFEIQ